MYRIAILRLSLASQRAFVFVCGSAARSWSSYDWFGAGARSLGLSLTRSTFPTSLRYATNRSPAARSNRGGATERRAKSMRWCCRQPNFFIGVHRTLKINHKFSERMHISPTPHRVTTMAHRSPVFRLQCSVDVVLQCYGWNPCQLVSVVCGNGECDGGASDSKAQPMRWHGSDAEEGTEISGIVCMCVRMEVCGRVCVCDVCVCVCVCVCMFY